MSSFVPIGGPITSGPTSSFTPLDATPSAPVPAPTPTPAGGFISNVISGAKSIASDAIGAFKDAFSSAPAQDAITHPLAAAKSTVTDFFSSLTAAGQQMTQHASTAMSPTGDRVIPSTNAPTGALDTSIAGAQAGLGAISAAFAPVNAVINAAQHVPALGYFATLFNATFGAAATGGGDAGVEALHAIPSSIVSPDTKAKLTPVVRDLSGLLAQIALGKGGDVALPKAVEHANTLIDTLRDHLSSTIPESDGFTPISTPDQIAPAPSEPASVFHGTSSGQFSTDERGNINFGTNKDEVSQFAGDQGKVVTVPLDKLNVKDFPTKEAMFDAADSGRADHLAQGVDMLRSENHAIGINPDKISQVSGVKVAPSILDKTVTPAKVEPLKTEPGQSRIGKSIEVKAVDAALTKGFDKTAGYDPITIKDQAERATKLINETPDQARAIIRGEQPLPDGLKGTALITAMEEHIKANPSGDLAHELANSPLVTGTSHAAQEMRLMAERVPDSITAKFQEIKAAREAALEKRGGATKAKAKVTEELKKEIRKNASKRQSWEDFAKEIACNY